MTLSDIPDIVGETKMMDVGQVLKNLLEVAKDEGRVSHGSNQCAKLLEIAPENVMFCILPRVEEEEDFTIHIQHTLIEAFCWENEIRLLQVDGPDALAEIITPKPESDHNNNECPADAPDDALDSGYLKDFNCVIVESPHSGDLSGQEQRLIGYYDDVLQTDGLPPPVITLPV